MLVTNSSSKRSEPTGKNKKFSANDSVNDENERDLHEYLSQDKGTAESRRVQEVASSAIIDSLSAEWWNSELSETLINDMMENLIPLVVLGCEKVISEADDRHLIGTTESDRSFNPINHLASFLMRNNPKYMHYSSLSPYHYSMKSLLNTKRVQVLKIYGEEETQLRSIVKQRQAEREQQKQNQQHELERRRNLLTILFNTWNVPERGWIQTKLINNMIQQSNAMVKAGQLNLPLATYQSHRMHLGIFIENFLHAFDKHSTTEFDQIMELYQLCAKTYTRIFQEHTLDLLLRRVFDQLDDKKIGCLLKKNVLQTLQAFFYALHDDDKRYVHHPDRWPVMKPGDIPVIDTESPEHTREPTPEEKGHETPANSDQTTPATLSVDVNEEQVDDDEKKVTIELRKPSSYDLNFRYINEQPPIYNLEHFDTDEFNNPIPLDDQLLNRVQFSALLLAFLGAEKNESIVCALIDYFRTNYRETPDDKNKKRNLLHQRLIDAQRRSQVDGLFEKLNVTCTRFLKMESLAVFLRQYRDGTLLEHIEPFLEKYQNRTTLNNAEFYDFLIDLHQSLNESLGGSEKFEDIFKFLESQQPQLSGADRTRAHTRHQWIKRLRNISYRNVTDLYNELMEIIQKDSDAFAHQTPKNMSIYIAVVDDNNEQLKYVAATNDQADFLLGKTLKRGQGVSFQILDTGKWAYINQTKNHTRLHFFNSNMKHVSGSFVLLPLRDLKSSYSVGVLGIDTIREKKEKAFVQHEVQFYEGLAATVGEALTALKFDKIMMKIIDRFIYWTKQRFPQISSIDYYTYEPKSLSNSKERQLRHVLRFHDGTSTIFEKATVISSSDHVFKHQLEYAAVTCQSTVITFVDQTHFIQPMNKNDLFCFAVIDTNIGDRENLTEEQKNELIAMYSCLSTTVQRLEQEFVQDMSKEYFNYEKQSSEKRFNYLFDRVWLKNISHQLKRQTKDKLQDFIHHKSKWNEQIKQTLSIISQLVKKKDLNPSEYQKVLIPAMIQFDPTSNESLTNDQWNRASQLLENQSASQHGSSEIVKLFSDWLIVAHELYKISK